MKLNKRQFCIAVNTFRDMLTEQEMIVDALDMSPEWKPGEWIGNYYDLLADICDLEVDDNYGTDLEDAIAPIKAKIAENKDIINIYPARYIAINTLEGNQHTLQDIEALPNGKEIIAEAKTRRDA